MLKMKDVPTYNSRFIRNCTEYLIGHHLEVGTVFLSKYAGITSYMYQLSRFFEQRYFGENTNRRPSHCQRQNGQYTII